MKKILFLLFIVNTINAQIKGVVLDALTKQPLAYSNVILKLHQKGVATNLNGEFELSYISDFKSDTLSISYLGYQTLEVALSKIKKDTVCKFFLNENNNLLDEVIITTSKKLLKPTHKINTKRSRIRLGHNLKYNEELVKLVLNDKGDVGKLNNVKFYFVESKSNFGVKLPVYYRLRFYTINNTNNKPEELVLLNKDVIIKPEDKEQGFEINLEDFNVKFPKEGLFIGLQTINPSLKKTKAGLFYVVAPMLRESYVKETYTYYRDLGGKWTSMKNRGSLKKNSRRDLIVDVEVKYYED